VIAPHAGTANGVVDSQGEVDDRTPGDARPARRRQSLPDWPEMADCAVFENASFIVKNERPLKAVVIRPNAGGDDQYGDELTQFQQPKSLSEPATRDQSLLHYASPRVRLDAWATSLQILWDGQTCDISAPSRPLLESRTAMVRRMQSVV